MRIQFLFIICLSTCLSLQAQLPTTNIMLFEFNQKNDSTYAFKNPAFLTAFNKNGYNNQPYFISNDELYITVQTPKDTTQTDIFALNLKNKKMTQVTATIESEYSPTFIPPRSAAENYEFSCVRVEQDGSQRLWRFPLKRNSKGSPVFENIKNIGYHFWVDYRDIILFAVGTPHKMLVADSRDESARFVTSNIGRCFQELPDGSIAYIEKVSEESWLLKKVDARNYRTSLITATIAQNEDFVILKDGTIIMANGTRLYKFNQRKDTSWKEIANLGYYGMNNISRIAVNTAQNKIAIVID